MQIPYMEVSGLASRSVVANKQLSPTVSYGFIKARSGVVSTRAALLPSGGAGRSGMKVVEKGVVGRRGARHGGANRDVSMKAAISVSLDGISGGGDDGGVNDGKKTGEGDEEGEEGWMTTVAEWWITAFNVFAGIVLLCKGIQAVYFSLTYLYNDGEFGILGDATKYDKARVALGRGVVLSLEFLLISDILETVVVGTSLKNLTAIGMKAVIRTIIDYFTSLEIEEALHEMEKEEEKRRLKEAEAIAVSKKKK